MRGQENVTSILLEVLSLAALMEQVPMLGGSPGKEVRVTPSQQPGSC